LKQHNVFFLLCLYYSGALVSLRGHGGRQLGHGGDVLVSLLGHCFGADVLSRLHGCDAHLAEWPWRRRAAFCSREQLPDGAQQLFDSPS
jgi:hypothetical protein